MRHRPSGKTLNALRDEYMTRYSAPRPAHVAVVEAPVSKRAAATKRRRASTAAAAKPAEAESSGAARAWIDATPAALGAELGSVLSDGATSIATLRAQGGVHGNKELAHVLERKLQRTRALLLRVLAYRGTQPSPGASARALALVGAALDTAALVVAPASDADDDDESSGASSSDELAATLQLALAPKASVRVYRLSFTRRPRDTRPASQYCRTPPATRT